MSASGDTMSTSGGYRGVFSTSEGYHEYIGGCSVDRRYIMSTSGDIMSTSGGYHEYIGGYHEYIGGYHEYIGGYHEYIGGIS